MPNLPRRIQLDVDEPVTHVESRSEPPQDSEYETHDELPPGHFIADPYSGLGYVRGA